MKNSVLPGRNGGTLLSGGVPGNRGGGRLRNEVREKCAELVQSEVVPFLQSCLASGNRRERKWAAEILLRYGIGQRIDVDEAEAANSIRITFGKEEPVLDEAAFEAVALSLGFTRPTEPLALPVSTGEVEGR